MKPKPTEKMTAEPLRQILVKYELEIKGLLNELEIQLRGRKVKIVKPWTGKVFEIDRVHWDGWPQSPITLFLKGVRFGIRPEEVEFL